VRLDIVLSDIRTGHFRNASQASYNLHIVLGCSDHKCVIIVSCEMKRPFSLGASVFVRHYIVPLQVRLPTCWKPRDRLASTSVKHYISVSAWAEL
jgi:hypothetical protein